MFEDLLKGNKTYIDGFILGDLSARAAKEIAVVTCIDTRIEPLAMLDIKPGDAKIIRNAGGRVSQDVLRSLMFATTFLGVNYVAIMHHSECALGNNSDEKVREALSEAQLEAVLGWDLLTMPDPEKALQEDVERVRNCAALPLGVLVEGWRYNVRSGIVTVEIAH